MYDTAPQQEQFEFVNDNAGLPNARRALSRGDLVRSTDARTTGIVLEVRGNCSCVFLDGHEQFYEWVEDDAHHENRETLLDLEAA